MCLVENKCVNDMFYGSFPIRRDELGNYPRQVLSMSFAYNLGRSCCPGCKHIHMHTEPEG